MTKVAFQTKAGSPAGEPSVAVRASYDFAAATAVRPVAFGVGAVCLGYVPLHLLITADGWRAAVLAASAAVSALLAFALFAVLRGHPPATRAAHPWLAALVVLATYNCALNLALTGEATATTNFVIVIIGAGACMVSTRWVLAMVVLVGGTWLAIAVPQPDPTAWLQPGATIVGGIALSIVLNVSRRHAIGSLVEARESAERASMTDSLTGLFNRRGFSVIGGQHVRDSTSSGPLVSVTVVDVDEFKSVNDQFGHEAGDRVLEHVGSALRACCRDSDVISRWGGDEFAVVAIGQPVPAEVLAERLNAVLASSAAKNGVPRVTVSIGVAAAPAPVRDHQIDELFAAADRDMYERRGLLRVGDPTFVGPG